MHGGGIGPNSAEGAPTNHAADETSTQGIASPLGIPDAVSARQNLEETAASDNPGQVPTTPRNNMEAAEASDNNGQ